MDVSASLNCITLYPPCKPHITICTDEFVMMVIESDITRGSEVVLQSYFRRKGLRKNQCHGTFCLVLIEELLTINGKLAS